MCVGGMVKAEEGGAQDRWLILSFFYTCLSRFHVSVPYSSFATLDSLVSFLYFFMSVCGFRLGSERAGVLGGIHNK